MGKGTEKKNMDGLQWNDCYVWPTIDIIFMNGPNWYIHGRPEAKHFMDT